MKIDLDRADLLNLVSGVTPNYSVFGNPLVKECGRYCGGFKEEWQWISTINKLSDDKLWELYLICKNSWKNGK